MVIRRVWFPQAVGWGCPSVPSPLHVALSMWQLAKGQLAFIRESKTGQADARILVVLGGLHEGWVPGGGVTGDILEVACHALDGIEYFQKSQAHEPRKPPGESAGRHFIPFLPWSPSDSSSPTAVCFPQPCFAAHGGTCGFAARGGTCGVPAYPALALLAVPQARLTPTAGMKYQRFLSQLGRSVPYGSVECGS